MVCPTDLLDILRRRFGVLPAHAAVERVGVGAEAGVGLHFPVLEVVPRFEARTGEVGNFVTRDSHGGQPLDGHLVELRHLVFGGGLGRAVAGAAAQHLLAEAAVFVHLQHVDGNVRRGQAFDPIEGFAPARQGLAGEARDEIDVAVADAGGLEKPQLLNHGLRGVFSAGAADFLFHKRLHAQAHAIDAARGPRAGLFGGEAAGSGFDGGFQPGTAGNGLQDLAQGTEVEIAGRAAAQVDRFGLPLPRVRPDLRFQRVDVARFQLAREHPGREIAERALLRAERVGKIDARHSSDCSLLWVALSGCRRPLGRAFFGRSRDAGQNRARGSRRPQRADPTLRLWRAAISA